MRQNLHTEGKHTEVATSRQKIICGDNRKALKEFEENYFDAIVTDPPYEIKFMSRKWDASGIAYDIEMWKECLRVLKPGGHLLAFGGTRTYHRMACAIEDAGFENFETKLFGQSGGALTKIKNGETEYLQENHIGLNKIKTVKNNHPTVKPIELMCYLIRLVTQPDGIVLDPFAGSGTTGIACALEGFNFVGIEQEEEYCRIAEARIEYWQNKIEKEKDNQPSFFDKASGE